MDAWLPILKNLKLSRAEQHVVERYAAAPHSRLFLPVSDILRNHNLPDESLEMLMRGVENHPRYSAARVILARDLLQRGMPRESWDTLENTVDSLKENILAQKVRFKLAIILGKEFDAREIYGHLRRRRMLDKETNELGEKLRVMDFKVLRETLRARLRHDGVLLTEDGEGDAGKGHGDGCAKNPPETGSSHLSGRSQLSDRPSIDYDQAYLDSLVGYQTLSLKQLASLAGVEARQGGSADDCQMDSGTLAEIYEKQRYFKKALGIYRRLLDKSPQSEWLQNKVRHLTKAVEGELLDGQQRVIDPSTAGKIVRIDAIDDKLRFLNELLRAVN